MCKQSIPTIIMVCHKVLFSNRHYDYVFSLWGSQTLVSVKLYLQCMSITIPVGSISFLNHVLVHNLPQKWEKNHKNLHQVSWSLAWSKKNAFWIQGVKCLSTELNLLDTWAICVQYKRHTPKFFHLCVRKPEITISSHISCILSHSQYFCIAACKSYRPPAKHSCMTVSQAEQYKCC
jgi:hypothetical protein